MPTSYNINLPVKFQDLFKPARYKIYYGGRGGAKSESFAMALVVMSMNKRHLVLCTRMYQNSILDSCYKVIVEMIHRIGVQDYFDIQKTQIICKVTGSLFIFKGLYNNIQEIKSLYGVTIMWAEEAVSITEEAWLTLDPTIRANNSEIWVSYNPDEERAPTHVRFVLNPQPDSIVVKVNWRDNPFFPPALEKIRRHMQETDPDNYQWVWEGECRQLTDASVFHNKLFIKTFDEPPEKTRFYHGLDFGFSNDPTVLIRCWIKPSEEGFGEDLMVDREAYGHHIELDEMPDFFDRTVETARIWPILADNENPAQISYLSRQGFSVTAADKWKGCAEDGIVHMRAYRKIIVHETRCPNAARELRMYRYKVDKNSLDADGKPLVLPLLEQKSDHVADSLRYSLSSLIQNRGGMGVWQKLLGR